MKPAIRHPGYALVDVMQSCVTFNKLNTYDWYEQRAHDVAEDEGYDPTDRVQAWERVNQWGDRIPIGVMYRNDEPTYEEGVRALQRHGPPARWTEHELPDEVYDAMTEAFT